jgi:hypothetical protein
MPLCAIRNIAPEVSQRGWSTGVSQKDWVPPHPRGVYQGTIRRNPVFFLLDDSPADSALLLCEEDSGEAGASFGIGAVAAGIGTGGGVLVFALPSVFPVPWFEGDPSELAVELEDPGVTVATIEPVLPGAEALAVPVFPRARFPPGVSTSALSTSRAESVGDPERAAILTSGDVRNMPRGALRKPPRFLGFCCSSCIRAIAAGSGCGIGTPNLSSFPLA